MAILSNILVATTLLSTITITIAAPLVPRNYFTVTDVLSRTVSEITGSTSASCEGQDDACVGDVTHWDGGKFSLSPLLNPAILTHPQDSAHAAQLSIHTTTWRLHCQPGLWVRALPTIPSAEIQSLCTIRKAGRLCRPLSKTSAKAVSIEPSIVRICCLIRLRTTRVMEDFMGLCGGLTRA